MAAAPEPTGSIPPVKSAGSIFGDIGRDGLAALEAAARRELSAAKGQRFGISAGLFGRKS
jgi:hypothetical protein